MEDLGLLVLTLAFFALAWGYIEFCERLGSETQAGIGNSEIVSGRSGSRAIRPAGAGEGGGAR